MRGRPTQTMVHVTFRFVRRAWCFGCIATRVLLDLGNPNNSSGNANLACKSLQGGNKDWLQMLHPCPGYIWKKPHLFEWRTMARPTALIQSSFS